MSYQDKYKNIDMTKCTKAYKHCKGGPNCEKEPPECPCPLFYVCPNSTIDKRRNKIRRFEG